MDSFADFIANAVEFLVGGILSSLALVVLIVDHVDADRLTPAQVSLLSANSSLLFFMGIAIAYAVGVAAESMARWTFEWLLDRITVRTRQFLPSRVVVTAVDAPTTGRARLREWIVARALGAHPLAPGEPKVQFTIQDRSSAREERERQRSTVMTWHVSLYEDVQAQLKRLRLERVFALSLFVTTLALAGRQSWTAAGWALGGLVIMSVLVEARFGRYCKSIYRGFERVTEDKMRQTSGTVITGQEGVSTAEGISPA